MKQLLEAPITAESTVAEQIEGYNLGVVRPVGDGALLIGRQEGLHDSGSRTVGNIAGRTASRLGSVAFNQGEGFALRPELLGQKLSDIYANGNLRATLVALGIPRESVLRVAVTNNDIVFGDQVKQAEGNTSPWGWKLASGNAVFFREDEFSASAAALADCGFITVEGRAPDGVRVLGFIHSTAINARAPGHEEFVNMAGQPVSYIEYALEQGLRHYQVDPVSVTHFGLEASIAPEHYLYRFANAEALEKRFAGWRESGYLHNATDPAWQPGMPVDKSQEWRVDAQALNQDNIAAAAHALGISTEALRVYYPFDPAEANGQYSSNSVNARLGRPDTRDLYLMVA